MHSRPISGEYWGRRPHLCPPVTGGMINRASKTWLIPARDYAIAALLWLTAVLVRELFGYLGTTLPYAQFYPAVLLAAVYGGFGPGLLVTIASLLYGLWAYVPRNDVGAIPAPQLANALLFALSSGLIIWVAIALRQTRARLELAVREMQHRGKNTFVVVDSIIRQSLNDAPEIANTISGRVRTVSSTNDLIAKSEDLTVGLEVLIEDKLKAFNCANIDGPSIKLSPNMARTMSLMIHELCTNAVKYGALSTEAGTVRVRWWLDGPMLHLTWEESGGPRIDRPPAAAGFGSSLLERLTSRLGGDFNTDFGPSGVKVRLSVRL